MNIFCPQSKAGQLCRKDRCLVEYQTSSLHVQTLSWWFWTDILQKVDSECPSVSRRLCHQLNCHEHLRTWRVRVWIIICLRHKSPPELGQQDWGEKDKMVKKPWKCSFRCHWACINNHHTLFFFLFWDRISRLRRWQPSPPRRHHGCPQTPCEAQDRQKKNQEVHPAPVRPICQN